MRRGRGRERDSLSVRGSGAPRLRQLLEAAARTLSRGVGVADPDEGYATTRLEEALASAEAVGLVGEHLSVKEA